MCAYRSVGRLTAAAQRLDLLQLRADRRRQVTGSQTPGFGECEWHWTDLKAQAWAAGVSPLAARRHPFDRSALRPRPLRWHA
jgi:hypothetical protein